MKLVKTEVVLGGRSFEIKSEDGERPKMAVEATGALIVQSPNGSPLAVFASGDWKRVLYHYAEESSLVAA